MHHRNQLIMKYYLQIAILTLLFHLPPPLPAQNKPYWLAGSAILHQSNETDSLIKPESDVKAAMDSLIKESGGHIKANTGPDRFQMQKSPLGAVWRSFIIPGWGQIYVESYWKAPLFLAAAAGMAGLIVYNNNLFQDYTRRIDNLTEPSDSELRVMKSTREFYRDSRDLAALYMLGVYVVAAVDAYVGAHLYDFNVDENISAVIIPNRNGFITFRINYHF